jgi:GrpB-like predicted nucleotidyltransferase (UPF0157 family)
LLEQKPKANNFGFLRFMPASKKIINGETMRKIEVVDYSPHWTEHFQAEVSLITPILSTNLIAIEHIGSTAVPNLTAKPIIDILLEVQNLELLDSCNQALAAIGYKAKGENGISGRRYFQKGGDSRTHHIHAFMSGNHELFSHRVFRDYLIAFPNIANEYAKVKQHAAISCNNNSALYCDLKADFIAEHLANAVEWSHHSG